MLWESPIAAETAPAVFEGLLVAWRDESKKVFVLRGGEVSGPVRDFYESRFAMFGAPVALAEDARSGDRDHQRTNEVWMEVRFDPTIPDAYRHSSDAQPLHTDGSYIPSFPNSTLMVCVANAGRGGETIFIDGEDVVACLQREQPALLERLTASRLRHARSGDERKEAVIDVAGDRPLLNWNYFCVREDEEGRALADEFHHYLRSSPQIRKHILPVKLGPGDAVMWKDRAVLHGRNAFEATTESERFLWKCAFQVGG